MKTRIAVSVLGVLVLGVLALAGCTDRPGTASTMFAAPDIGVFADADLQVVAIVPESAGEKAGLQIGDVLLDLTWIPSDAPAHVPEGSDVIYPDATVAPANGEDVVDAAAGGAFVSPVIPPGVPAIPPPVESYIDKGTVPFTEVDRIKSLVSPGVPLKLRVMRGEQVLELTIVPIVPPPLPLLASGEIMSTPTPVASPSYYY